MKLTVCLLSVVFIFVARSASVGAAVFAPTTLWTAQTPDQGTPSVAIQPNGNVVLGSNGSGSTATLTGYSSNGTQLWRNAIGVAFDTRADNVRVDSAGNIYVAGSTYTSSYAPNQGAADVTLQKFDPNGVFQWGRQFGTQVFDWSSGLAVTTNGTSYITSGGWASNYNGSNAGTYTTVHQYFADGTPGWTTNLNTHDGTIPGESAEGAEGTSVAPSGNIIAAFSNYTSTFPNNPNTLSFYYYLSMTDSSGQPLWLKSINLFPVSTAVDSVGDIYVAGRSLEKFDSAGNLLWSTQIAGLNFQVMCLGADGTIYAADGGSGRIYTFDSSGDMLSFAGVPQPNVVITQFTDIAISGNELAVAALFRGAGSSSGTEVAVMSVPEPEPLALFVLASSVLLLGRRGGDRNGTRQRTG